MPTEAVAAGSQNLVDHRKLAVGIALEVLNVVMPLAKRTVSGCLLRLAGINFDSEEPRQLDTVQTTPGTTGHHQLGL